MVLARTGLRRLPAPLLCGVMALHASSLAARPALLPSAVAASPVHACSSARQCCWQPVGFLTQPALPQAPLCLAHAAPHSAGPGLRDTKLSPRLGNSLWGARMQAGSSGGAHAVRRSSGASASTSTAQLSIELVPCLSDNYAYLLHDAAAGVTAVVDPSEAAPVRAALRARQLQLTHILNTHHHWDHTGGNLELKKEFGAQVVGPAADKQRIPGIDVALAEGDTWQFGGHEMHVFDTPGHTRGHVSFYFPGSEALFTGDTLFSLGCGKLFEGTPQQMWASLSKLAALPAATRVYCGHEYTQSNARFAWAVESGNERLAQRSDEIARLRSERKPTIPTTLGLELATNPFLRPSSQEIREAVRAKPDASDAEVFAAIRRKKDSF
ncbi:Glyoxylase [Klebsormidium nitens]|uniref:hydroxyacylglutathione hydrolase n=1 Tax=Klebsormidium nitens TaxID=105231 RepID=A0A1Y1ITR8_KLENI|nr:Glyoxylase [Klebsormidium nitens]|eukprot:GAQ92721.1 Glyoxylase [Klebsormidium nitens]